MKFIDKRSDKIIAITCRSKIGILNVWFNLKMHFVGLSIIII
jgi:hypothetical protein